MPRDETANAIGLAYMKAYADAHPEDTGGARVSIFETQMEDPLASIVTRILAFEPDFIGFQCLLCGEAATAAAAVRIRELAPEITIMLGGTEAGNRPGPLLAKSGADFVVVGEAEHTFVELLGAMSRGASIRDIPGLIFPDGDGLRRTAFRPAPQDVSAIPSFYEIGEEHPEEWGAIFERWSETGQLVIETSRGCPFNCAFCSWPKNQKPRDFPLTRVRRELEVMMRLDPTAKMHFADPDIFWDSARALQILPEIHRADPDQTAHWWFNTYFGHMTEEMARLCNHRGFVLEGAVQSTGRTALKNARRRFGVKAVARGVRLLQEHAPKAWLSLQLILGLPGDDRDSFLASYEWILQFGTAGAHAFPMQLMPGTEFMERKDELGIVADPNPPYLVTATHSFPEEDIRFCRRVVLMVGMLRRRPQVWKAVKAGPPDEPLWQRAMDLARFVDERHGLELEETVASWESAINTYLTPISAPPDPSGRVSLMEATLEWLHSRLTPEQVRALPEDLRACPSPEPSEAGTTLDPALSAWLAQYEARFQGIIDRRGGIDVGPHWTIARATADPRRRAVILTARAFNGEEMTLALQRAGEDAPHMAASDRFQLSHLGSGEALDRSRELALQLLMRQLGLRRTSGPSRRRPNPEALPTHQQLPRRPTAPPVLDPWSFKPPGSA